MKNNPITIGIDDAAFHLRPKELPTTSLIGVVCQGTRMVGIVRNEIDIDGDDSTEAIIDLIRRTEKHAQYVLTDTITFGGFNLADIEQVHEETGKAIIAITERRVDIDSVLTALKMRFPDQYRMKVKKIVNAGNLYETSINTAGGFSKVYFHVKGIEPNEVEELLEKICIDSKLPECVRMAHIIGTVF